MKKKGMYLQGPKKRELDNAMYFLHLITEPLAKEDNRQDILKILDDLEKLVAKAQAA